jgi:hypothetical protein
MMKESLVPVIIFLRNDSEWTKPFFTMLRTQFTPNFYMAEHYGLWNTTCLHSKDVASDDNCLQKPINQGNIHIFHSIFFSAGFRPLLYKIGGRTAAKFSLPIIFLFGRFCVILQNFRPAGNSGSKLNFLTRRIRHFDSFKLW